MKGVKTTNGLFGISLKIDEYGEITNPFDGNNDIIANTQEDVYRATGLRRELLNAERFKVALSKPEEYLQKKQTNLEEIGTDLSLFFQKEFLRYMKLGYTQEKARKLAMENTKEQKKKVMEEHNEMFPTQITSSVINSAFRAKDMDGEKGEKK